MKLTNSFDPNVTYINTKYEETGRWKKHCRIKTWESSKIDSS
jgi:hypothetical protein